MDTVVFLGPTLALSEAQKILPRAAFRPPAAMGDVYRALRDDKPRRIALIDGYFERMAAPWHKEILFALESGVRVYGASSMGALRAAELAAFGMIGVGQIYEDFAAGRLTDDDEVAVLHGPAERGYAAVSEAMVNVRAGIAEAVRAKALDDATADALIALAKAQFYRDRTWETVIAAGRSAGLPVDGLAAAIARARPDAKAADARALLKLLTRATTEQQPAPRVTLARTWFWWRFVEAVEEADRTRSGGGRPRARKTKGSRSGRPRNRG